MNIDHLRLFVRIAASNNISRAGRELGLSPAVASAYISKLEHSLGVRLIHRTTRQISLTEDGIVFLPHAEDVIGGVEHAKASVGAANAKPQGTIRIAASASFGRMHLIPAMGGFFERYPDLNVDFRFSDTMLDMVEGGFDIAIRNASLNDSNLIAKKLASDTRIVCASPKYLEKHGVPKQPADLEKHKCVDLIIARDSWTFRTPKGLQKNMPKYSLRVDNGESVRDACVDGVGLAISSIWCAYKHLKRGELVTVLDDYPLQSDVAIWAVYPSSRLLAPKVRVFIDYFSEYFGETPYWDEALTGVRFSV